MAAAAMKGVVRAEALEVPGRLEATSLELSGGELTCLIGPNGSGKTSLLHALAGIGRAGGTVSINGIDPRTAPLAQRGRLLSYLPASRDIGWPLLARDIIALGTVKGSDLSLDTIVEDLELAPVLDRRADRLSTGERSRVLIARALAAEPRLLLLDEPISNLDPLWQLKLMDYLRALTRRTGQTIVAAVHDLEIARTYADRLIIMSEGRVAADGIPDELLEGQHIPAVFGVERGESGWRLVAVKPADRQSSQ
jgi:iron complex transport system ATP-binding protein